MESIALLIGSPVKFFLSVSRECPKARFLREFGYKSRARVASNHLLPCFWGMNPKQWRWKPAVCWGF
jgi:hypothetical protein